MDLAPYLDAARDEPEAFAAACPDDGDERHDLARVLRDRAETDPATVADALPGLVPLLGDDRDPVRLLAAKTYLAVAEADPGAVPTGPLEDALDDEFYYVRARAVQALGRVARARGEVDPSLLARLLNGLELEREESRERYAGALADCALADPSALRTLVPDIAEALDDESAVVRYHLATALAAVAREEPGRVAAVTDALEACLGDEEPYVAGRAAEALGHAGVAVDGDALAVAEDDADGDVDDEALAFRDERVAAATGDTEGSDLPAVAEGHDTAAEAVATPDDPVDPALPPGHPDGPGGPGGPA
jgi:HEAT repeat protein